MKALSKRRINENTDRLPLDYFGQINDNPLYRFDGNELYFYLESLKEGKLTPN